MILVGRGGDDAFTVFRISIIVRIADQQVPDGLIRDLVLRMEPLKGLVVFFEPLVIERSEIGQC